MNMDLHTAFIIYMVLDPRKYRFNTRIEESFINMISSRFSHQYIAKLAIVYL